MPLLMLLQNPQSEIFDHNSTELNAPQHALRCGKIPIARDLGHPSCRGMHAARRSDFSDGFSVAENCRPREQLNCISSNVDLGPCRRCNEQ
jgi:hypothetical protein